MADDLRKQADHPHAATLRQRYANAIGFAYCTPYAIADAVLKVRDEEMERLRGDLYQVRLIARVNHGLHRSAAADAERAEAALSRVREWAEKMREQSHDEGMGAFIRATLAKLLDGPAVPEEQDGGGHDTD